LSELEEELNEIGLAYIAGLFDGEGYIYCSLKKHVARKPTGSTEFWLTVSNPHRPVLEHLKAILGGRIYASPRKESNQKTGYFWKIGYRQAFRALHQISPYLEIKREHAELALQNEALISKRGRRTPSERKKLTALVNKMNGYTKRGA
jgi:hypothetical protein